MKLALRLFCVASLLCASWAAVGADDKAKKTGPQSVLEALPRPASKLSGSAPPASPITPSAAVPAGSAIAVLSPPTTTVAMQPTVTQVASPIASVPVTSTHPTTIQLSHGTLQPTPEMWFYEQERQDYMNPELQSRRRGEAYAAERRARMAARAWYGYSNSRPTANVTPLMSHYSAGWGSNTSNPYIWSGRGATTAVVVEARRTVGITGFGSW